MSVEGSTQATGSVIGTWAVEISTPLGTQQVTYTFEDTEDGLRGRAVQGADTSELQDLRQDGSRLVWIQQVTRPMRLRLQFEVMQSGDALNGTAKAGALPSSKVRGKRVSAAQ